MASEQVYEPVNSQAIRRTKYGLNVTVAVLAALGLVVLVNVLSAWHLKKVFPLALLGHGEYSLSPKTRKVLSLLKPQDSYRVVTLLRQAEPDMAPHVTRAKDLIDLYSRYAGNVQVEHIQPDFEAARLTRFLEDLRQRYAETFAPTERAVKAGQAAMETAREQAGRQQALLNQVVEDPALPVGDLRGGLTQAAQFFVRWQQASADKQEELRKDFGRELPAYEAARSGLESFLSQADERHYGELLRFVEAAARRDATPPPIKEKLLAMVEEFKKSRQQLSEAVAALRAAQNAVPEKLAREYDDVRDAVYTRPNSVVVLGPRLVKVLWLDNMFALGAQRADAADERPPVQFLGEEQITGALVQMTLDKPPLVVFVSGSGRPATGPGGEYGYVSEQLEKQGFDVRSWSPGGQAGPMGMMPPSPPPEPQAGQPVVWVLLPSEGGGQMDMMGGGAAQQGVEFVQKRITDKGESALIMAGISQGMRFGPNPLEGLLQGWGLRAATDKLILREVTGPDGRKRPQVGHEFENWPTDLPLTQALVSLRTMIYLPSPLELLPPTDPGIKQWPLVTLRSPDIWAEKDYQSYPNVERDPQEAGPFVCAAAVEKGSTRLVVVTEPLWATDRVAAAAALTRGGGGLAIGLVYPGNGELFVNSVEWLAHLEDLIAASPRTQDIPRVGPLSPASRAGILWGLLAGMPAAVVLVGVGVWLKRRNA